MNSTTLAILAVIGLLVALVVVASALDRRSKSKGNLFTQPPSPTMRILAILLGLIFGGIFVAEMLWSEIIHIWPPILAVALLAYAFGAEKLIVAIQKMRESDRGSGDPK
jgi:hypothetical protein